MFFEKRAGLFSKLFLDPSTLRGLAGAATGAGVEYKLTDGMDPLARIAGVAGGAATGGYIGASPRDAFRIFNKVVGPNGVVKFEKAWGGLPATAAGVAIGDGILPKGVDAVAQSAKNTRLINESGTAEASAKLQSRLAGALPWMAGGVGLLGLGGLAAYLAKPNNGANLGGEQPDRPGRMMLTLPASKENPHPTVLDLPLSGLRIPKKTLSHIGRDTRRVLRLDSANRDIELTGEEKEKAEQQQPGHRAF